MYAKQIASHYDELMTFVPRSTINAFCFIFFCSEQVYRLNANAANALHSMQHHSAVSTDIQIRTKEKLQKKFAQYFYFVTLGGTCKIGKYVTSRNRRNCCVAAMWCWRERVSISFCFFVFLDDVWLMVAQKQQLHTFAFIWSNYGILIHSNARLFLAKPNMNFLATLAGHRRSTYKLVYMSVLPMIKSNQIHTIGALSVSCFCLFCKELMKFVFQLDFICL